MQELRGVLGGSLGALGLPQGFKNFLLPSHARNIGILRRQSIARAAIAQRLGPIKVMGTLFDKKSCIALLGRSIFFSYDRIALVHKIMIYLNINTSQLINYIAFKDSNAQTNGTFTFFVNDSSSITGNGYTELKNTGSGLTAATVLAHINNSAMEYDLELTLESKADFLRAALLNFVKK